MKKFLPSSLLLACTLFSAVSFAKPIPLSSCSISDFSGATACFGAHKGNDKFSSLKVNKLELFGGDWDAYSQQKHLGKKQGKNKGVDIGLMLGLNDGKSGEWAFSEGALAEFDDYLVVLKAGNGFSAYLVDDSSLSSGDWSVARWSKKGLSHVSVYVRGESQEVTEPASAAIFLLGLLGAAGFRRRLSKAL